MTDETEAETDLTIEAKLRICMSFMGTMTGLHEHLDKLREDDLSVIDHNIEQAQLALESAFLRTQQLFGLLHKRKEAEDAETP